MCLALARLTPRAAALASAAMPPVLVHRAATRRVDELGAGGLPLGSRLRGCWGERTTALAPGDTLLFASDGFPELADGDGRVLGFPGAAEAFARASAAPSARSVLDALTAEAAAYRGARPQDDDVTFVVVRVTGDN
jgi:serine phosphatase RsbU (regulator of sigma subunit)